MTEIFFFIDYTCVINQVKCGVKIFLWFYGLFSHPKKQIISFNLDELYFLGFIIMDPIS